MPERRGQPLALAPRYAWTPEPLGSKHWTDQRDYGLETALVAEVVGAEQALLTTTRDNAKVLRMADDIGTLEPGKLADLVLVNGDPLADPRLLADPSHIAVVVKDGEIVKDIR